MTRAAGAFAAGMGLGAGLMYFFDPDRGRRRRTHARNRMIHASHAVRDNTRAQLLALQRAAADVDGQAGANRVRAFLGRVITHEPKRMPALATVLAGAASLAFVARALNARPPEFELRP